MDENEKGPTIRVVLVGRDFVNGKGDVLNHVEKIGEGKSGQNGICRINHDFTGENDKIEQIGKASEEADGEGKVAMNATIDISELCPTVSTVDSGHWDRPVGSRYIV